MIPTEQAKQFRDGLESLPLHLTIGPMTITVQIDDPDRDSLNQAIAAFLTLVEGRTLPEQTETYNPDPEGLTDGPAS